jgi:hypothetical protein
MPLGGLTGKHIDHGRAGHTWDGNDADSDFVSFIQKYICAYVHDNFTGSLEFFLKKIKDMNPVI